MKLIYSSPDSGQVGFVKSLLEAAEIQCEVRNDAVSQAMVGLPFNPELWIRDEDYDDASRVIAELQSR